jgi:hypothetical protein
LNEFLFGSERSPLALVQPVLLKTAKHTLTTLFHGPAILWIWDTTTSWLIANATGRSGTDYLRTSIW